MHNEVDRFVFYSPSTPSVCMYLVAYVNDIVIIGNDEERIIKLKHHLFSTFGLGRLGTSWALKLLYSNQELPFHKEYNLDILEKTEMTD